mmetsp:Transcript_39225/g.104117  ORF Transcript_39225/g.104117 Transcript_39225/m.104117 type:complete len:93 (-) Transcript_39225:343-621(-)
MVTCGRPDVASPMARVRCLSKKKSFPPKRNGHVNIAGRKGRHGIGESRRGGSLMLRTRPTMNFAMRPHSGTLGIDGSVGGIVRGSTKLSTTT